MEFVPSAAAGGAPPAPNLSLPVSSLPARIHYFREERNCLADSFEAAELTRTVGLSCLWCAAWRLHSSGVWTDDWTGAQSADAGRISLSVTVGAPCAVTLRTLSFSRFVCPNSKSELHVGLGEWGTKHQAVSQPTLCKCTRALFHIR